MNRIPNAGVTWRVLAAIYLPAAATIAIVAALSLYAGVPVGFLTRDRAGLLGVHPVTGLLSNLGILVWSSCAFVALFSAIVLRKRDLEVVSRFLLSAGVLTLVLLFDDFFLFHEYLARNYLGIREEVVYAFYALATSSHLILFRRLISRTEYHLLGAAFAFFAISIAVDMDPPASDSWLYLVEDGSKFLGICSWCAYYVRTSFRFVVSSEES